VLAAPNELSEAPLPHEAVFYERKESECTFWATHPETPAEYVADGFSLLCDSYRKRYTRLQSATDQKIIAEISKTRLRQYDAQYRTGQIADIVNALHGVIFCEVALMHESMVAGDDRQKTLSSRGVRLQTLQHDGTLLADFKTTQSVVDEGMARADKLCAAIFRVFSLASYDDHRSGGLTA
jgi:hypothetical protein